MANNQIANITGIEGLSNLRNLYLWNNQISDISPVKGLSNLQSLYLSYNQISDITAIEGLSNLNQLYLDNNQITDRSVTEGLSLERFMYSYQRRVINYSNINNIKATDIIPKIIYQDYKLNESEFEGSIYSSRGKSVDIKEVMFDDSKLQQFLKDNIDNEVYTRTKMIYIYDSEGYIKKLYGDHHFTLVYEGEKPAEGISISEKVTGTGKSKMGTYSIDYSANIEGTFKEGINTLTKEQINALTIKGKVIHNVHGDSTNANHSSVAKMDVVITNGKLEKVIISGNVKTKSDKAEAYEMILYPEKVVSKDIDLTTETFKSPKSVYDINLVGKVDRSFLKGKNKLTQTEINALDIKINVLNNKTGTTREMAPSTIEAFEIGRYNSEIISVTISGRAATSDGTVERYTKTIYYGNESDYTVLINTGDISTNKSIYTVNLNGKVLKSSLEGKTTLTLDEIKKLEIVINAVNNSTGTTRELNSSTIEELTINYNTSNNIESIKIKGRVATADGKVDRYEVTIPA